MHINNLVFVSINTLHHHHLPFSFLSLFLLLPCKHLFPCITARVFFFFLSFSFPFHLFWEIRMRVCVALVYWCNGAWYNFLMVFLIWVWLIFEKSLCLMYLPFIFWHWYLNYNDHAIYSWISILYLSIWTECIKWFFLLAVYMREFCCFMNFVLDELPTNCDTWWIFDVMVLSMFFL